MMKQHAQHLQYISFSEFKEEHLNAALRIFDLQFGKDYLSIDYLQTYIQEPEHFGKVVLLEGELLGLSLSKIGPPTQLSKHLLKDADWFEDYFAPFSSIALRKHSALHPKAVGKGIGRQLVQQGIEELLLHNEAVVSLVWKENAAANLGKILQSVGAQPIHEIADYWAEDSLKKGYDCPGCFSMPCCCTMQVYCINKY